MENDRELLELAAKAAGHQIVGWNEQHGVDVAVMKDGSFWQPLLENPITDCMGDALRLAINLNMGLSIPVLRTPMADVITFRDSLINVREYGDDIAALTRRAIVRAAAEVGRAME